MNDRQRFLSTMKFSDADRPPLVEWGFWEETLNRWRAEGLPEDKSLVEVFGFDNWWGAGANWGFYLNFGPIPPFESKIIEETDNYKIWTDGRGVTRKDLKHGNSMPQWLDFPVKNSADWKKMKERLMPGPQRCPKELSDDDLIAKWNNRDNPFIISSCASYFGWLRDLMGLETLLITYYDDPSLIHEITEHMEILIIETWKPVLSKIQVDCANFWEDMAYKAGPFISPKLFREFMLPSYIRTCEFFRKHGVEVIAVDSDGNIEELIPLFIEAGVDVVHPLEVAAGMDVVKLRKQYGKNISFWGNIDKRELAKGKRQVKAEVFSKVPKLIKEGGYVPFFDHHVPPDVSLENYIYYLELLRNIFGMGK